MANWQIHRFGDAAGISTGAGETVYLDRSEARRMAKALNAVARSIDRERFSESPPLTKTGTAVNPDKENRRPRRTARTETGEAIAYERESE